MTNPADPIHKIKHVVVVMQENRSFDTYFGTYPAGGKAFASHGCEAEQPADLSARLS